MLAVVLAPVQMHLTMSVGALARIPAVAALHHLIPYGGWGCQAGRGAGLTLVACRPRLAGGEGRLVAP
jgi:hypothetical protein